MVLLSRVPSTTAAAATRSGSVGIGKPSEGQQFVGSNVNQIFGLEALTQDSRIHPNGEEHFIDLSQNLVDC